MPIATLATPAQVAVEPVQIAPEPTSLMAVDSEKIDRNSLHTYLQGSRLNVEYFRRLHTAETTTTTYDADRPAAYQPHHRVTRFELRIPDGISFAQDADTTDMTASGTAMVYGVFIPNKADFFIADVGDGRLCRFNVTQVTRKSIRPGSPHEISFQAVELIDKAKWELILSSVVETFVFNLDLYREGGKGLIHREEAVLREEISHLTQVAVRRYLTDFYSPTHRTLIVPDQSLATYDGYLVDAIRKIVGRDQDSRIGKIDRYSTKIREDVAVSPWDAILQSDEYLFASSWSKYGLASTVGWTKLPYLRSIATSGIRQFVSPKDGGTNVDNDLSGGLWIGVEAGLERSCYRNGSRIPSNGFGNMSADLPQFPVLTEVVDCGGYLFRPDFYRTLEPTSLIEVLVSDILRRNVVQPSMVKTLYETLFHARMLEQFYYLPILFIASRLMMRVA